MLARARDENKDDAAGARLVGTRRETQRVDVQESLGAPSRMHPANANGEFFGGGSRRPTLRLPNYREGGGNGPCSLVCL